MKYKLNKQELGVAGVIFDAESDVTPGKHLEIHKDNGGYYAWEYSDEYGYATPVEAEEYKIPLFTEVDLKEMNVDIDKVFLYTGSYVS